MPVRDIARARPVLPNYRGKTNIEDPLAVWIQRQIGAFQEVVSRLSQDPDLTQENVFVAFIPVVLLATALLIVRFYASLDDWTFLSLVSIGVLVDLAVFAVIWFAIQRFTKGVRAFLKQDWIVDTDDRLIKKQ